MTTSTNEFPPAPQDAAMAPAGAALCVMVKLDLPPELAAPGDLTEVQAARIMTEALGRVASTDLRGSVQFTLAGQQGSDPSIPEPVTIPYPENFDKDETPFDRLSPQLQKVLRLVMYSHENWEIADKLEIAKGTVDGHMRRIYRLLDVPNRTEAISRAFEVHGRPTKTFGLSEREITVVEQVGRGLSNDQIARELGISKYTVKTHIARAMRKTKSNGREHLVAQTYELV